MSDKSAPPDKVLGNTDRGDDIQRRFRYQAAYAALISLHLLDEKSEFDEVFCEHHEDVLVKLKDATFIGFQVKTREASLGPFTFSDSEIMKSLKRFIECEKTFPNRFKRYVICSNCGFWEKANNSSNLVYCLKLVKECVGSESTLPTELLQKIATLAIETKCDKNSVLRALGKVETQKSMDLERYEFAVTNAIAVATSKGDQSLDVLKKATDMLIETIFRASSLPHASPRTAYFALLENPPTQMADTIIKDKRITKEIVQKTIYESLSPSTSLRTVKSLDLQDLPRGMRVMEMKMAKGGISAQNIDLTKDLKYSAEKMAAGWIHKYGLQEASRLYEHLYIVVRNESQEAYDLTKNDNTPFGTQMLTEVRKRLRDRYSYEIGIQYNDCKFEHMLGIAGILTENCKLWWSESFEIPKEKVP